MSTTFQLNDIELALAKHVTAVLSRFQIMAVCQELPADARTILLQSNLCVALSSSLLFSLGAVAGAYCTSSTL